MKGYVLFFKKKIIKTIINGLREQSTVVSMSDGGCKMQLYTQGVLSGGLFYVKRNESRNWCAWGDYILRLFDRVASPHMPFDMATVGTNIRTGQEKGFTPWCESKYFLSIYLFGQRQIYWLQEKRF